MKRRRATRWLIPVVPVAALLVVAAVSPGFRDLLRGGLTRLNPRPAAPAENPDAADPFLVHGDTIRVPDSAAQVAGITSAPIAPATQPVTLRLTGRTGLDLDHVTHVHAQFAGRVVEIGPQLGESVKGPGPDGTGATRLCVIESIDLANAKSDYLKAKVQLELDSDNLKRAEELVKTGVLSEKAVFDAQNAVQKSTADLAAARQKLFVFGLKDADLPGIERQQGRERMAYDVYAPRSGAIIEKNVAPGELADPTANLFTIADPSTLWVWGNVYERDWARLRVGQQMQVVVSGDPDHPRTSTVDWISPVLDGTTRSVRIRGRIDNSDHHLLAEMYATLTITLNPGAGALLVPTTATVRTPTGTYLMVQQRAKDGATVYERRRVQVEPVGADQLRVTDGLQPGEVVVLRGALGLAEEMTPR